MINNAIASMLKRYNAQSVNDYQNALKEIFQELALLGLWRAKFFEHAAFYGGTALRLLYGLDRFSEDLDFSLLVPNTDFDLSSYHEAIRQELLAFGFESQVVAVSKAEHSPINSAFIKANTLQQLLLIQVPKDKRRSINKEELIKVKFELDTDPPPRFHTEPKVLLQPIPFSVNTYQMPDLFAGKLHAIIARGWKGRVKGRDWYDLVWYIGRNTPVRLAHLSARLEQSGHLETNIPLTEGTLQEMLKMRIDKVDLESAKHEVRPFLKDHESIALWSKDFFTDLVMQIRIA